VAFATLDPFSAIEACVASSIRHLNGLRINTGGTGLSVAAFKDSQITASDIIQMRPGTVETPLTKIVRDDAMRRQIMRQRTPGNAASNDIENPVENLAFGIRSGSTAGFCFRKKWLKNLPWFIIEVSGIGFSYFHTASLSQETNPIPDFFDTL
jgi:hypothetical protein